MQGIAFGIAELAAIVGSKRTFCTVGQRTAQLGPTHFSRWMTKVIEQCLALSLANCRKSARQQ